MNSLSEVVLDFVVSDGACAAGIATVETLAGGPPSTDLSYVLPDARSAVVFAIPIDQSLIPAYLKKEDRLSLGRGVCATSCPVEAIQLEERPGIHVPPVDQKALREAIKASQA